MLRHNVVRRLKAKNVIYFLSRLVCCKRKSVLAKNRSLISSSISMEITGSLQMLPVSKLCAYWLYVYAMYIYEMSCCRYVYKRKERLHVGETMEKRASCRVESKY